MVKTKRGKRGLADEPPTPISEPDTVPPTAPSTAPQNPFAKWLVGLVVLSLLVIGGPVALWAQSDTGGKKVSVDAAQLQKLQDQLKSMEQTLQTMSGTQQAGMVTDMLKSGVTCKAEDGRSECLNDCRKALAQCKAKGGSATAKPSVLAVGGLDQCLADANSCVTKCNDMPRPPISCQDRCAVALGGCLEYASLSSKANAVESCRTNNRTCLVKACKLKDENSIPDDACPDQCKRMEAICKGGSASYSKDALALCDKLKGTCQSEVCKSQPQTGKCTEKELAACNDTYKKYIEAGDEAGAKKMQQDCIDKCTGNNPEQASGGTGACSDEQAMACEEEYKKCSSGVAQGDQKTDEIVCFKNKKMCLEKCQPPQDAAASCDDKQAYACDKIRSRCMDLNKNEAVCDAVQSYCQKTCTTCGVEQLGACHDKYAKCESASCFNEITDCFDSCGSASSGSGQTGGTEAQTSPAAAPLNTAGETCYKEKCVPEYQNCQMLDNANMDICSNELMQCKNTCYGTIK